MTNHSHKLQAVLWKESVIMSRIKEWFLTHIDEFSDEELLKEGYSQEEIDFLKRRDIKNEKES